uniref:Uncharacterized protein n=1 Tax=Oryza glaberrima TaxID=4538 RepID=I1NXS9_ORYGL
ITLGHTQCTKVQSNPGLPHQFAYASRVEIVPRDGTCALQRAWVTSCGALQPPYHYLVMRPRVVVSGPHKKKVS